MPRLILGAFTSCLWASTAFSGTTGPDTENLMQTLQSCLRPVIKVEVWTHEARPEEAVDIAVSTCLEEFKAAFESMPTPVEQAAYDEHINEIRDGMVAFAEQMIALGPLELDLFGGGGLKRRPPTPASKVPNLDMSQPNSNAAEAKIPFVPNGTQSPADGGGGQLAYEFQGITLGMPLSEFQQLPHPQGNNASVRCTNPSIDVYVNGKIVCQFIPNNKDEALAGWQQVIGATEMPVSYSFLPDDSAAGSFILYRLDMESSTLIYQQLYVALSAKFGKPVQEMQLPMQNGFGATFLLYDTWWQNGISSINLKTWNFAGRTSLSFMLDRIQRQDEQNSVARQSKPNGQL